jgi:hypothetical protein
MKIPFKISEFVITGHSIPTVVADKILKYHITPMVPIRHRLATPITASKNSGYRPDWYEKKMKRSGKSQHCFIEKGAVDWTCSKERIEDLLKELKTNSPYTRVSYYPNNGFIHCDYKPTPDGKRHYYECDSPTSKWVFKNHI